MNSSLTFDYIKRQPMNVNTMSKQEFENEIKNLLCSISDHRFPEIRSFIYNNLPEVHVNKLSEENLITLDRLGKFCSSWLKRKDSNFQSTPAKTTSAKSKL